MKKKGAGRIHLHSKSGKAFFLFMAFIMVIGYPLLLISSLPQAQALFGTGGGPDAATKKQIREATGTVRKYRCDAQGKAAPKSKAIKSKCKDAFQSLGSGYRTLAYMEEGEEELPRDAYRNLELSLKAYTLLVKIDPEDNDSRGAYAQSLEMQGEYDKARLQYKRLAKDDPQNANYLYALGRTAQNSDKIDEAIDAYSRFIKKAPDDPEVETAREAIKALKKQKKDQAAGGAAGAGLSNITM